MSEEIVQGKVEIDVTNYLNNIDKTLQKLTEYMEKNETVNKNVRDEQEKTSKSTKGLAESAKNLLKVYLSYEGLKKLFSFLKEANTEYEESLRNINALNQALKTTGQYSEIYSKKLQEQASTLQKLTGIEDDEIITGQRMLLTFTNIGQEALPEATKAALDMSVAMGQDMQSSALQLGKALNNPVEGLSALSRVGISFSATQKKMIEDFMKQGDILSAQKIILKEVNKEFGGMAETMKKKSSELSLAWKDFLEAVGEKTKPAFDFALSVMTGFFKKASELIKGNQITEEEDLNIRKKRIISFLDYLNKNPSYYYATQKNIGNLKKELQDIENKLAELDAKKRNISHLGLTAGDIDRTIPKTEQQIEDEKKAQEEEQKRRDEALREETERLEKTKEIKNKNALEILKNQEDFIDKEKKIEDEKTSCQLDENEKRLKIQKNYQEEVKESTTKMNEYILDLKEKEKESLEDEMKQAETMAEKRDKQHKAYVAKEKKDNLSLISSQESLKNAKENSLNDVYDLQSQILQDTLTGEWKGLSEYGKIITQQIQMEYAATAAKAGIGSLWHFALGLGDLAAAMMGDPKASAAATTEFETAGQMAAIAATAGATSFIAGAAGRGMGGGGTTEATSETVSNATIQQKAIKESLTQEKRVYISEADYFKSVRNGINPALQKVLENGGSFYVKP